MRWVLGGGSRAPSRAPGTPQHGHAERPSGTAGATTGGALAAPGAEPPPEGDGARAASRQLRQALCPQHGKVKGSTSSDSAPRGAAPPPSPPPLPPAKSRRHSMQARPRRAPRMPATAARALRSQAAPPAASAFVGVAEAPGATAPAAVAVPAGTEATARAAGSSTQDGGAAFGPPPLGANGRAVGRRGGAVPSAAVAAVRLPAPTAAMG